MQTSLRRLQSCLLLNLRTIAEMLRLIVYRYRPECTFTRVSPWYDKWFWAQASRLRHRNGVELEVLGITNSQRMLVTKSPIMLSTWEERLASEVGTEVLGERWWGIEEGREIVGKGRGREGKGRGREKEGMEREKGGRD